MPEMPFPSSRSAPGYQVIVYVYEYESNADGEGNFVSSDLQVPAADHVRESGLSALKWTSPAKTR